MSSFIFDTIRDAIPAAAPTSVVDWARPNVRLVGSAISEEFRITVTPWLREPLECAVNGVHRMTFIKPVQCGGSTIGEIALCYWACVWNGGDIQYNWPNDAKAEDRWVRRVEKILKACPALMKRFAAMQGRFNWRKGLVVFPSFNLIMQGVNTENAVASDSIRGQVNEEIHIVQNGWSPGKLDQCYHRLTQFYNHVIFNISNGSRKGDQLNQAFDSGTCQYWENLCPHCKKYHYMRIRWDDKQPKLGGLRYDVVRPKPDNIIVKNIRYQFPCGGTIPDDLAVRRRLSLNARYSEPTNAGAPLTERSYTLQAVAVDSISWLELIREKQKSIHALKMGDKSLYEIFVKERECGFWTEDDRPISANLRFTKNLPVDTKTKQRIGLPDAAVRFGALDRQGGHPDEGINPYWWGVIQDVNQKGDTSILWEGKLLTDDEAAGIMFSHGVQPNCVVADSRFDTTHVYGFCIANGFNAIMGDKPTYWVHPNKSHRIFSPERPLHAEINAPSKYPYIFDQRSQHYNPDPREPLFWFYSKGAIRERLAWWRSGAVKYIIPDDVSAPFIAHQSAEALEEKRNAKTGETTQIYVQHKGRNDLYVCCAYIAMLAEMGGFIGQAAVDTFTVEVQEETEIERES